MNVFVEIVKVTIPKYLQKLPIPETVDDVQKLSGEQWLHLSLFLLGVIIVLMSIVNTCFGGRSAPPPGGINHLIQKDKPKVATLMDIEDLAKEKNVFCRCWKSKKFPYCDGSHAKHNEQTGDNVGPLVIEKKQK